MLALLLLSLGVTEAHGAALTTPDWSENAVIPVTGRANPYGFAEPELSERITRGKIHAQVYPVEVSAALVPYRPVWQLAQGNPTDFLQTLAQAAFRTATGWKDFDAAMDWLGLHPYPAASDSGIYQVPHPDGELPDRMGMGFITRAGVKGFTFSCAACHSARLFGKTVLGMTNRFPHANDFFVRGKEAMSSASADTFADATGATTAEKASYEALREAMNSVEAKKPVVDGLDTSLAQVALSLAHRAQDAYASIDPSIAEQPREEMLKDFVADSKPAVWWNLKYKTRWLSDGSVVSGNPLFTNLLWNEIGRGTDLHELETWLGDNEDVIEDLTTAVFSTEAPKFTDFFPAERIDLASAKRGQALFSQHCAECHGHYLKAWDLPQAASLSLAQQLETTEVHYQSRTRAVDVGTDPQRAQAMVSLARGLNPLAISAANGILIEPGRGYVPPPLVGIWARWPYFHNNSAPSLCAVLTRADQRPTSYVAGEAEDPAKDFDRRCNGYPEPESAPAQWTIRYDLTQPGLKPTGHDDGILSIGGKDIFSPTDKEDLIHFLQTL
jgi:mono/diheme cytochrome c family protein